MSLKYRNAKYEEKTPNISILNRIDIFLIKEVVTERPLKNLHTIRYK